MPKILTRLTIVFLLSCCNLHLYAQTTTAEIPVYGPQTAGHRMPPGRSLQRCQPHGREKDRRAVHAVLHLERHAALIETIKMVIKTEERALDDLDGVASNIGSEHCVISK